MHYMLPNKTVFVIYNIPAYLLFFWHLWNLILYKWL